MGYLVLFLNDEELTDAPIPSGWLVDEKTHAVTRIAAVLSQIQSLAQQHQLLVIVPGEDVLLMPFQLPTMSKQRLRQALPYALEEQLIPDVESLHFALPVDLNRASAAIVSRARMDHWLRILSEWKLKPRALMPLTLLIPADDSHFNCVLYGDKASVRLNAQQGFTCDAINLADFLQSTMHKPEQKILIHDYAGRAIHLGEELIYEVLNHPARDWQADLLAKAILPGEFNLLQGAYHVKQGLQNQRLSKKLWTVVGIWLGLIVCYPLISYLMLQTKLSSTNHTIDQLARKYLPHQMVSRRALHAKFAQLAGADTEIFSLLKNIALAKQQANVEIMRLQYQPHRMTLQIRTNTSEQLAAFVEQLQRLDPQAKQDNVDVANDSVTAMITL